MSKKIFFILLTLCSISIAAQNRNVLKSICKYADGTTSTRTFQYDSIGRVLRIDEYDGNENITARETHSIHGQSDSIVCYDYEKDEIRYRMVYVYADERFQQKLKEETLGEDGAVSHVTYWGYDSIGRLVYSQYEFETREYSYEPYTGVCIVTRQHDVAKVSYVQIAYWDENCTMERSTKMYVDGTLYEDNTTYCKDGRIKVWNRYENGKLVEQIKHRYHGNTEIITNLFHVRIKNFY